MGTMDKTKYKNLCEEGKEKWRFARGMNRNAELHGEKFSEIVRTSMKYGQQLLDHLKNCEGCNISKPIRPKRKRMRKTGHR